MKFQILFDKIYLLVLIIKNMLGTYHSDLFLTLKTLCILESHCIYFYLLGGENIYQFLHKKVFFFFFLI